MFKEVFGDKLKDAYLYGSYARGDYDDESDIDILITVDKEPEELVSFHSQISHINNALSLDHDITVSAMTVPYERFLGYSKILPFYMNVLKDGIKYVGV